MRYLCGNKAEYSKYLERTQPRSDQYIDPDGTYKDRDSVFYNGLVNFLMAREKPDAAWSYSVHSYTAGNECPAGIWVERHSEPVLYLRSDQLGFSAPHGLPEKSRTWNQRKFPYAAVLSLGGEADFVADCIWDVRTLGGSFLWPLTYGRNWRSWYNIYRGANSYIEDSVDLTLYEIKSFYDLVEKKPDMSNEMLCKQLTDERYLLLRYSDKMKICEWLKHFNDFKGYIDELCFQPFVDDQYQIIDIAKAELTMDEMDKYGFTDDAPVLSRESVDDYRRSKRIASIKDRKRLEQVLNNVRIMTVRRTNEMEKVIEWNI